MEPKIETNKGWVEIIIDEDSGFDKFYKVADVLQTNFGLTFTNKLDGLDNKYWDFEYRGRELVLFCGVYEGITIFPRAFENSVQSDNESAVEIGMLLFRNLNENG